MRIGGLPAPGACRCLLSPQAVVPGLAIRTSGEWPGPGHQAQGGRSGNVWRKNGRKGGVGPGGELRDGVLPPPGQRRSPRPSSHACGCPSQAWVPDLQPPAPSCVAALSRSPRGWPCPQHAGGPHTLRSSPTAQPSQVSVRACDNRSPSAGPARVLPGRGLGSPAALRISPLGFPRTPHASFFGPEPTTSSCPPPQILTGGPLPSSALRSGPGFVIQNDFPSEPRGRCGKGAGVLCPPQGACTCQVLAGRLPRPLSAGAASPTPLWGFSLVFALVPPLVTLGTGWSHKTRARAWRAASPTARPSKPRPPSVLAFKALPCLYRPRQASRVSCAGLLVCE